MTESVSTPSPQQLRQPDYSLARLSQQNALRELLADQVQLEGRQWLRERRWFRQFGHWSDGFAVFSFASYYQLLPKLVYVCPACEDAR